MERKLAFGLTLQLLTITGQSVVVLLLLTAALGVLLGMGMPTVGVYIIMATLIAPALVKVGIAPMADACGCPSSNSTMKGIDATP